MSTLQEKIASNDFLKIVCVGDIQTAQTYGKPGWTDWLQRSLWENGDVRTSWRRKVINSGIDRATPRHVSTYFREYIGHYKPDIVLLSFGVSPMFPSFEEKQFLADMNSLLDMIQKEKITTILWSPYPLLTGLNREISLTLGALYKQLSVSQDCQFIDVQHEFDDIELAKIMTYTVVTKNDLFGFEVGKPDVVTLNEAGNYIVARKISRDAFGLQLPQTTAGTYFVPNLELVKRW
ncbi:MAG: SGNH/GDSL hydrolase family protein [Candidatus Dojkabacteria bacterium]|nr:MAG: SGNH/GDSL hydrolase family protein [Candidatus Dojkabacteria bacterium]